MSHLTLSNLTSFVGREIGVSDWVLVDQARIDAFAACTGDHQWIHVDAERARRESPLGTTIAHGYLTLSLLPMMTAELGLKPAGAAYVLNYGADKIRYLNPVKSGSRLRVHVTLAEVTPKGPGRWLMKSINTVEIEGEEKPALVAETLALIVEE